MKTMWLFAVLTFPLAAQTSFNWRTRSASDPMLTGSQRVEWFLRNDVGSASALFRTIGPAIGSQFGNRPPEWGKTAEGFGRRVGSNFAVFTSRDLIISGAAAARGLDPRYQRCNCSGGWKRTGYAIAGVFLLAGGNGERRFDVSNLAGAYGAGFVGANLYPDRYSRRVKGLQLGHQQVGQIALGNLALEFGPDIRRFFKHTVLRRK